MNDLDTLTIGETHDHADGTVRYGCGYDFEACRECDRSVTTDDQCGEPNCDCHRDRYVVCPACAVDIAFHLYPDLSHDEAGSLLGMDADDVHAIRSPIELADRS